MSRHHLAPAPLTRPARLAVAFLVAVLALLVLVPVAAQARPAETLPVEDYASYSPQSRCSPHARPGTVFLGRWMVRQYGGRFGSISRHCSSSTSEHQEGRAFDWGLDASKPRDRARAAAFLERVLRTDRGGNEHAWARRMGIMYVIWSDRMWSAWDGFRPEPYLSSSCRRKERCSRTLRHRDHVHVSLTRAAGMGRTSWFASRLPVR